MITAMFLSAAARVATCTPTLGLHSSSRLVNSNLYFESGFALCSFTASSAELRPPSPCAEFEPVRGPMNASLTASAALAAQVNPATIAVQTSVTPNFLPKMAFIMYLQLMDCFSQIDAVRHAVLHQRSPRACAPITNFSLCGLLP